MKKFLFLSITFLVCLTMWSQASYQDFAIEGYAGIDTISMQEGVLIYAEEIEDDHDTDRDTIIFEDFPMVGFVMSRYRAPGEAEALVGSHCYQEKNYELAVKYCTTAAKMGDELGQLYLGLCYYNGNGVVQNHKTAVKWFKKAAIQESRGGQYYLGLCYYNGEGVSRNYKEAAKWLKTAAMDGLLDAIKFLKDHAEELGPIDGI